MGIKDIIDKALASIRGRGDDSSGVSGAPETVGASGPGEAGGHKSATADPPRTREDDTRTTASEAAANSGDDVSDAASGKED